MAQIIIKKHQNGKLYEDGGGNIWQRGSILREESSRMNWDDVRQLCIDKGLYTHGDAEAYTMLNELVSYWEDTEQNITTEMLQIVAEDILENSNGSEYSIEALMFELQRSCVRRFYSI